MSGPARELAEPAIFPRDIFMNLTAAFTATSRLEKGSTGYGGSGSDPAMVATPVRTSLNPRAT